MCHKSPPQAEIFRECPFKRSLNTLVYTLKTQKCSRLRRANSLHFPLCMCLNPKIFAPAASKISVACIRPQIPQTVPATGKIPASPLYTLSKLEHFHVCDGAKYSLYSGGKCCAINSPPQTRFFYRFGGWDLARRRLEKFEIRFDPDPKSHILGFEMRRDKYKLLL